MKRFILLILSAGLLLSACTGGSLDPYDTKIKEVRTQPQGFTALQTAQEESGNIFSYVFWESQVSFLNLDQITIYQRGRSDESVLVLYEGELHISNEALGEVLAAAEECRDAREKQYMLGEPVQFNDYLLTVVDIRYEGMPGNSSSENEQIAYLEISAKREPSGGRLSPLHDFFNYVVLDDGSTLDTCLSDNTAADDGDTLNPDLFYKTEFTGILSLEIPSSAKIVAIHLVDNSHKEYVRCVYIS